MCRAPETREEREARFDRQAKAYYRNLTRKILTRRALRAAGKMVVAKRGGRVTTAMRRAHAVVEN